MAKKPAGIPSAEDAFIGQYFAPIAGAGSLGLRDDAALIEPPAGCELVVTVDTLVAGVHFFANDPPATIARKALRVNLSDLAAKGADPLGFLLSFAMPQDVASPVRDSAWMLAFSQALGDDAQNYGCPLLGGDSVTTPGPLTLSVTAFGAVPAGAMVKRTGVQLGDIVFVTGTIGDAALGLHCLYDKPPPWCAKLEDVHRQFLIGRYREPQPRNNFAQTVRQYAHGAMDVSDGLAGDLAKMMRVSGTAAHVELAQVPFSDAAKAAFELDERGIETALCGGDDYEILCTLAPENASAFIAAARTAGVAVSAIGKVLPAAQPEVSIMDGAGHALVLARTSYSHF